MILRQDQRIDEGRERIRKSTITHISMEAKETLRRVTKDFPDALEAMGYFYGLFNDLYCERKNLYEDRIIIGTTCIQVPEELIYASQAVPVRLCSGSHRFEQIGAETMPARSCSLVKAVAGMMGFFNDLYGKSLELIVIPSTCDQKKKLGEMLEEGGHRVYFLDLPSRKDTEEAHKYWRDSLKGFIRVLQDITGVKITEKRLKDSIGRLNRARQEFRRLYGLRGLMPPSILGKDVLLVTNAFFFDDIDRWTKALRKLNDEIEERIEMKRYITMRDPVRILLTGSPSIFPNLKLPLFIEEAGGVVVADDFCSSNRLLYDTIVFDEANLYDMLPSVADGYLRPCTCPFLVPNTDRRRRLLHMAEEFRIDGVIYQSFSGCHLFDMEHRGIAKIFEDKGIPMLYIETDYSPEDRGQLITRIEAFMESIKTRRI